jgi:hypothetical protein
MHVPGKLNKVADLLSRYYSDDTSEDKHPPHAFVNADARLDPDGETLPVERFVELRTTALRKSTHLRERVEQQTEEASRLAVGVEPTSLNTSDELNDVLAIRSGSDGKNL